MRIKNCKILCFILVIFIVLSGMCIENIEADYSFAYAPMEETNSYIMTDDAVISQAEPCTTEMLGVCNNAGIQRLAGQFINQKRESKVSLNFLYSNIFSLHEKERRFLISSKAITFCNQCQDELVVKYIHKSDGKKRI
ncbi:MAG: hypothetical protein HDT30_12455 [Clostridiales bacterium]|nr:hypothetical protein [Clostridiales bacterium]